MKNSSAGMLVGMPLARAKLRRRASAPDMLPPSRGTAMLCVQAPSWARPYCCVPCCPAVALCAHEGRPPAAGEIPPGEGEKAMPEGDGPPSVPIGIGCGECSGQLRSFGSQSPRAREATTTIVLATSVATVPAATAVPTDWEARTSLKGASTNLWAQPWDAAGQARQASNVLL